MRPLHPATRRKKAKIRKKEEASPASGLKDREFFESDEVYRLIVESAETFAIFAMDLDGTIRTWNTGAESLFGFRADEMVGRDVSVLFVPEDRQNDVPEKEMQSALSSGRALDERWHIRKDGSRFWANGFLMPLHGPLGTIKGFLKIIRDETKYRYAIDSLPSAEEQLRRLRGGTPG